MLTLDKNRMRTRALDNKCLVAYELMRYELTQMLDEFFRNPYV